MNYRLELAIMIPADQKDALTVDMLKATVTNAANSLDETVLQNILDSGIKFDSLDDLNEIASKLKVVKQEWNTEYEARK